MQENIHAMFSLLLLLYINTFLHLCPGSLWYIEHEGIFNIYNIHSTLILGIH